MGFQARAAPVRIGQAVQTESGDTNSVALLFSDFTCGAQSRALDHKDEFILDWYGYRGETGPCHRVGFDAFFGERNKNDPDSSRAGSFGNCRGEKLITSRRRR